MEDLAGLGDGNGGVSCGFDYITTILAVCF